MLNVVNYFQPQVHCVSLVMVTTWKTTYMYNKVYWCSSAASNAGFWTSGVCGFPYVPQEVVRDLPFLLKAKFKVN